MIRFGFALLALVACSPFVRAADEPQVIPLWEKGPPGFEDKKDTETRDRENKETVSSAPPAFTTRV